MARKLWLGVSAGIVAIILFGLVGATITYWGRRELGGLTRSWRWQVVIEMLFWLTYLPLVPPALALARRFRLDPPAWQSRAIVVHVIGAASFSLAHSVVLGLVSFAITGRQSAWSSAMWMLANFSLVDFCLYFGLLAGFFAIEFYRESVARNLTAAHLRADLTEARLEALRIQLTPHFLFNTLNCMSTMALAGDPATLRAMIANLGELLRFSLDDRCPQEVSLGQELDFLDRYLELQRLQLGDDLLVHRDIPSDTIGALVPTLVLQPIVENAIVHGCSSRDGRRHISIRAVRDVEQLHERQRRWSRLPALGKARHARDWTGQHRAAVEAPTGQSASRVPQRAERRSHRHVGGAVSSGCGAPDARQRCGE